MADKRYYGRDSDNQRQTVYMTQTMLSAGNYTIGIYVAGQRFEYAVQRVKSAYGDTQWIVDRSDLPSISTANTLGDARGYIVDDVKARMGWVK